MVTQAEDALIAADAPIFQRGPHLVIPIVIETAAAEDYVTQTPRKTHVASLKRVTNPVLRDYLARYVVFKRYTKKGYVAIEPPDAIANLLLSRAGEWRVRPIAGVISCPTMRPDGSILIAAGYDPATTLYHIPDESVRNVYVPENPTREDALAALELLKGLLVEFPFKTEVDRSVALSELMCPVLRGAIRVIPLHLNTSPEPGSGKSYLWDTVSAIATGYYCPAISPGETKNEFESRMIGVLLEGMPLVSIDNIMKPLGSPTLNQATERPLVRVRRLGGSEMFTIDARTMFGATGNNTQAIADQTDRTLLCRLDANMERPGSRRFKADPFHMVLSDRDVYVAAVLTIARAYRVSGLRLNSLEPWRGYRSYTEFVRAPLVWLGCEDPYQSTEEVRSEDPDRSAMRTLFATWHALLGDDWVTASSVIEVAAPRETEFVDDDEEDDVGGSAVAKAQAARDRAERRREFRAALLVVAPGADGSINTNRLGLYLRSHKDRRVDGYQLLRTSGNQAVRRWRVVGLELQVRQAVTTRSEYQEFKDALREGRKAPETQIGRDDTSDDDSDDDV